MYFEQNDKVAGLKELTCTIPGYKLGEGDKFTSEEVSQLLLFAKCSAATLINNSKSGGANNA